MTSSAFHPDGSDQIGSARTPPQPRRPGEPAADPGSPARWRRRGRVAPARQPHAGAEMVPVGGKWTGFDAPDVAPMNGDDVGSCFDAVRNGKRRGGPGGERQHHGCCQRREPDVPDGVHDDLSLCHSVFSGAARPWRRAPRGEDPDRSISPRAAPSRPRSVRSPVVPRARCPDEQIRNVDLLIRHRRDYEPKKHSKCGIVVKMTSALLDSTTSGRPNTTIISAALAPFDTNRGTARTIADLCMAADPVGRSVMSGRVGEVRGS